MKIAEQFIDGDGDAFHVKTTFDVQPDLQAASAVRSAGVGMTGGSRLVGRIPAWIIARWMKDAGVGHNDNAARQEIIRSKMMSGEFAKFRVWDGSF